MFLELANGGAANNTVDSVREKYGLSGSYKYIQCEISQLEPKAESVDSGKIYN